MATAARWLAGAVSASREAFELRPTPCLGFTGSGLSGKCLAGSLQNGSRLQCATSVVPKKKDNLLAVAEQHWLRAIEKPLDGLSFSAEEFSEALSQFDFSFEMGQTVKGVVFLADKNGAFVDIGAKAPAFLPTAEASILKLNSVVEAGLVPGVEDDFLIVKDDDENGRMILSLKKFQLDLAWERCKQLQAEDAIITGHVIGTNRGGFVVDLEGLKGFVPFSHVASKTPFDDLVNKTIPLKFMEVDNEGDQVRLVLSNKKALAENQTALGIGTVVEGVVQSVKPYGAFIDMGGVSGLLHVSQISHERIADVGNVLQPGDKLKVMILSQDRERGRISLSTKRLEPTPGDMLRNPALVYESAEEMAQTFRQRIAQAEAAARAEELRMAQEGGSFGLVLEELDANSVPSPV